MDSANSWVCRRAKSTHSTWPTSSEGRANRLPFQVKADNLLFDDPGDDPAAPYHREHVIANALERVVAILLFVKWSTYNRTLDQESLLTGKPVLPMASAI
jgi:hypothetical protein